MSDSSNYKVGDLAALFPKPKQPKTKAEKKLQCLFKKPYVENKGKPLVKCLEEYGTPSEVKKNVRVKKSQDMKGSGKISNKSSGNEDNLKNKKRKFSELENSIVSTENKHVEKKVKKNNAAITEVISVKNTKGVKGNEENFPRGRKSTKKVFTSDVTNDKFVNIFNMKNSQTQEELNSQKKTSKNKFLASTTNGQKISSNKRSIKKRRKSVKHKQSEQMPNASSLAEAKFGLKSMLQKPKENSQRESIHIRKKLRKKQNTLESSIEISPRFKTMPAVKISEKNLSRIKDDSVERRRKRVKHFFKKDTLERSMVISSDLENIPTIENDGTLKNNEESYSHGENESKELPNVQNKLRGFKNREATSERASRTIFVGNLPLTVDQKVLKKIFAPCGAIECSRIRCSVPAKSTISKKVANITQEYHRDIHSLKGFVVFKSVDDVPKALAMNGTVLQNHHLRVDKANRSKAYNDNKSVFVGNLPFNVEEEALWSIFSECGTVEGVRVVRDRETGLGKGFGFVLFTSAKSVERAISLNETEIEGRQIRVKPVDNSNKPLKKKSESHSKQKLDNFKYKAIRIQRMQKKSGKKSGKKSIKKLMKKEKRSQQKKKIASMFQQKKSE